MKTIGLTGGIGAGKSSVIELLQTMDVKVLNCDEINAQLMQPEAIGYQRILQSFDDPILDEKGHIDSQKMSTLIFSNPEKKQQLEAILHPLIKEEVFETIKQHQGEQLIVVEVPLLFEVAWEHYFDEIWVVGCDEEIRLRRLQTYRQISRQEALLRIAHQMPQDEKLKRADVVLMNNGDKACLQVQIEHEVCRIREEG